MEKTVGGPCRLPGDHQAGRGDQVFEHNIGAVVMAAGWEALRPDQSWTPNWASASRQMSSPTPNSRNSTRAGKLVSRPSGRQGALKNVAFLQCAGSRDQETPAVLFDSVCCLAGLKQAVQIKEKVPGQPMSSWSTRNCGRRARPKTIYRKAQEAGVHLHPLSGPPGARSQAMRYLGCGSPG